MHTANVLDDNLAISLMLLNLATSLALNFAITNITLNMSAGSVPLFRNRCLIFKTLPQIMCAVSRHSRAPRPSLFGEPCGTQPLLSKTK